MKATAFFIGFMLVFIGASPVESAPIWVSLPPIFGGLGLMWWGVLPKYKNRYKR